MIDLHCHLLPAIDDGATDAAQALELARAAVADGITHQVATPHIHVGRYANDMQSIQSTCEAFQRQLEQHAIPLTLGWAAEVRLSDDLPILLESDCLPFLGEWGGDRVLLLELPHSHIPPGIERLIPWMLSKGVRPMIAHPERNRAILRSFAAVLPLVRQGCLIQVTAGAVAGRFGAGAATRARELLQEGMVTILATDAHHPERRPPLLSEGRRAAEAIVGESRAWDLVLYYPGLIAAGQFSHIPGRQGLAEPTPA